MLATIVWDGGPTGNGTSFLDKANWQGDMLPVAGDVAIIENTGTTPPIMLSGLVTVAEIRTSRDIVLGAGTLKNTVLTATGGAKLVLAGNSHSEAQSVLDNVTVNGSIHTATGETRVRVLNGLDLHGTMTLGRRAWVEFIGTQTLGGTGTVIFDSVGSEVSQIKTATDGMTLTIGAGITIRGSGGSIDLHAGRSAPKFIVNRGTITADVPGEDLVIHSGTGNTFVNEGVLKAENGGDLVITESALVGQGVVMPTLVNQGVVMPMVGSRIMTSYGYQQNAGELRMAGGTMPGLVKINGGTITGSGTITGDLVNGGMVLPGGRGAIGEIRVGGKYIQQTSGTLGIDVGGDGKVDRLVHGLTGGYAQLAGTLEVTAIDGYQPSRSGIGYPFLTGSLPDSWPDHAFYNQNWFDVVKGPTLPENGHAFAFMYGPSATPYDGSGFFPGPKYAYLESRVAPRVTISSSAAVLRSGQTSTITFTLSAPSTDFTTADIIATGGVIGPLSGSGTIYTATFTAGPSGLGRVRVNSGTFSDQFGAFNTAMSVSPPIVIDNLAPSVTIASDKSTLKAGETARLSFTLSEDATNFDVSDVNASGGTLSSFSGSGRVYTATFTPTPSAGATAVVTIAPGVFTDAAGNPNVAGVIASPITIDTVGPRLTIRSSMPRALRVGETATITLMLSEDAALVDPSAVTITGTGGRLSPFTGSGRIFTAVFTPPADVKAGLARVTVNTGMFRDSAGNPNAVGLLENPVRFDTVVPTVAITSGAATLAAGAQTTIRFTLSEPSVTFTVASITLTNGTLSSFVRVSDTEYTVTFKARAPFKGKAMIAIAANAFTDNVGNGNLAAELVGGITIV
ncbi:MAG: hypothetical protein KGQ61_09465 [Planctomycetes bacterium]|nr:hypothetical protein [Planctomycetota bacterium]